MEIDFCYTGFKGKGRKKRRTVLNAEPKFRKEYGFVRTAEKKPKHRRTAIKANFYENAPADYKEPLDTSLWIILGILSSLFCCLIGGIGTTVYAAKASGNVGAGDIEQAKENLKTAKGWFIATMIIAAIEFVFGLLIALIG